MSLAPENRRLAELLAQHSYLHRSEDEEPFRLASGRTSRHYFECKLTTLLAEAMPHVGRAFFDLLEPSVTSVGGLTHGADPIAAAVAFHSASTSRLVNAFSVRKSRKEHGTSRWIEGCVRAGEHVAIVDDVITSGQSAIQSIERCEEEGIVVAQVIVLIDREESGLAAIREALPPEVPVRAVFTKRVLDGIWEGLRSGGSAAPDRSDPSRPVQDGRSAGLDQPPAPSA